MCVIVNCYALVYLLICLPGHFCWWIFCFHSFFTLNVINRMSFSIRMKISYPRVYKIHMHTLLFEMELDFMCLPLEHCTVHYNRVCTSSILFDYNCVSDLINVLWCLKAVTSVGLWKKTKSNFSGVFWKWWHAIAKYQLKSNSNTKSWNNVSHSRWTNLATRWFSRQTLEKSL